MAFCFIAYTAIGQNVPQNLKVYNGDYTLNAIGAKGTAKYSYYENDEYQRIYHGDFTLSVEKDNFSGAMRCTGCRICHRTHGGGRKWTRYLRIV